MVKRGKGHVFDDTSDKICWKKRDGNKKVYSVGLLNGPDGYEEIVNVFESFVVPGNNEKGGIKLDTWVKLEIVVLNC